MLNILEEIKEITVSGKYDVLPVSMELLSDFTTPIEVMRICGNDTFIVCILGVLLSVLRYCKVLPVNGASS